MDQAEESHEENCLSNDVATDLEDITLNQFTCAVCLGEFFEPRALSCSHIFCSACIERIIQDGKDPQKQTKRIKLDLQSPQHPRTPSSPDPWDINSGRGHRLLISVRRSPTWSGAVAGVTENTESPQTTTCHLTCPICQASCPLPTDGVGSWPVCNTHVQHVHIEPAVGCDSDTITCGSDECTSPVAFLCQSGCGPLCLDCERLHQQFSTTSIHSVIKISQNNRNPNLINDYSDQILQCKQHPNLAIEYYCHFCKTSPWVCVQCILENHKGHEIDTLSRGVELLKKHLSSQVDFSNILCEELAVMKTILVENKRQIEDSSKRAIKLIQQTTQGFKDKFAEQGEDVIEEIVRGQVTLSKSVQSDLEEAKFIVCELEKFTQDASELFNLDEKETWLISGPSLNHNLTRLIDCARSLPEFENRNIKFSPSAAVNFSKSGPARKSPPTIGWVSFHRVCNQVEQRVQRDYKDLGDIKFKAGKYGSGPLEFNHAWGICIHPTTGNVFVADQFNSRIQVLTPDLAFAFDFGRRGTDVGHFNNPISVCMSPDGNFLAVTDNGNHRLQLFTPEGQFLLTIGSDGHAEGQFKNPINVAISAENGHLYVADTKSERVQEFTKEGKFIRSIGHRGCGDGEVGAAEAVTVTSSGELCVLARGGSKIDIFDLNGSHVRTLKIDRIRGRTSMIAGANQTLWISDSDNHQIIVYSTSGEKLRTFGSTGNGDGQFTSQMGIAFGKDGNFYVCDYGNNRIQVF